MLRQHGTELPYRNAYCRHYGPGAYACTGCGNMLFDSAAKYHATSGWPSFMQPVAKSALGYYVDESHHLQRMEVRCNVCGGHLGHVFADGPATSGLRCCFNSASLVQLSALPA